MMTLVYHVCMPIKIRSARARLFVVGQNPLSAATADDDDDGTVIKKIRSLQFLIALPLRASKAILFFSLICPKKL